MTDKTKEQKKYQGFFECENHDRLKLLLEGSPPTVCRQCHKKVRDHLTLYLAQTMTETLALENITMQHGDMIQEILERMEAQDKYIEQLIGVKTKPEKEKS